MSTPIRLKGEDLRAFLRVQEWLLFQTFMGLVAGCLTIFR